MRKTRKVVQDTTLHDLEAANSKSQVGKDTLSMVGRLLKPRKTEMADMLRCRALNVLPIYIVSFGSKISPVVISSTSSGGDSWDPFRFVGQIIHSQITLCDKEEQSKAGS